MKTINSLFIFFIFTVLLAGCGGGNSKSDVSDARGNKYSGETTTIRGKVIDGYLEKASVCVDANENGRCDKTDPQSKTDSQGNYAIILPKILAGMEFNLLAFAVPNKTIDADWPNQPIEKGYSLSAPWGSGVITPFTSMVVGIMRDDSSSKLNAEERVKESLKIDSLYTDYIAMKLLAADKAQTGEEMHKKAKMLVQVIASLRGKFSKVRSRPRAEGAYTHFMKDTKAMSSILSDIKTELQDLSSDAIDYETLQALLEKKAIQRIEVEHKDSFELALRYRDVTSADQKTQLLKHYLSYGVGNHSNWTKSGDKIDVRLDSYVLENDQWDSVGEKYVKGRWRKPDDAFPGLVEGLTYVRKDRKFKEVELSKGVAVAFDKNGNVLMGEDKFEALTVKYKLDLSRLPLALQGYNIEESLDDPKKETLRFKGTFPPGAEALSTTVSYIKDTYTIDSWKHDPDGTTHGLPSDTPSTLTELLNQNKFTDEKVLFASDEDPSRIPTASYISELDVAIQFDLSEVEQKLLSGRVRFYTPKQGDGSEYELTNDYGTWHKEKLLKSDKEILRVEIPKSYQSEYSAYFFIARDDPYNPNLQKVWRGEITRAGTKKVNSLIYNKAAKKAIKAAIESGAYAK